MKPVNPLFAELGTTIFETMSRLAVTHGAINLGQGFPDEDGPEAIRAHAAAALAEGPNQYPPMMGLPALREAVAAHARRTQDLAYDPATQVLVTSGATEALADIALALLAPGDEAVVFSPSYDCYAPMIARAGATVRHVCLTPPAWTLDEAELAAAFGPRTKLVLLNTPHNPTGKVFSADEIAAIGRLAEMHDAYLVCDEVYEHLAFARPHISPAALEGLAARTLRVGSAGKTFSMTGWKVGYVSGPADLVAAVAKAHQYVTFTTPPALQSAVAYGLEHCACFYEGLAPTLKAKRDRLSGLLRAAGLDVLPCEGVYFLLADIRSLGFTDDVAAAEILTREAGVACVPVSAFHAPDQVDVPRHLVRFCFAKREAVLDEAGARLKAYADARARAA